jgi:diguanylate cyclase (GGDEF)-like protein
MIRPVPVSRVPSVAGAEVAADCRVAGFSASPMPDARFYPVPAGACASAGLRGCTGHCSARGLPAPRPVTLPAAALDQLMPLHLLVGAAGEVAGCGRTLRKVLGDRALGARFFDLFAVRQPGGIASLPALRAAAGEPLRLAAAGAAEAGFCAVAVPLADDGGVFLNLSFGLGLIEAVAAYRLNDADFAPTDLVIDLLWMAEAKRMALGESRALNGRLQRAQRDAEDRALTDTLTGLRNRRALDAALADLAAAGAPFALMHLDLDHFKPVNDTLGHAAGDAVLRQVGVVLTQTIRKDDLAARVGGDEFVALFPGLTDRGALARLAARLVEGIAEPVDFHGTACRVAASIGIAVADGPLPDGVAPLMAEADAALYAAKRAGRGRALFAAAKGA